MSIYIHYDSQAQIVGISESVTIELPLYLAVVTDIVATTCAAIHHYRQNESRSRSDSEFCKYLQYLQIQILLSINKLCYVNNNDYTDMWDNLECRKCRHILKLNGYTSHFGAVLPDVRE